MSCYMYIACLVLNSVQQNSFDPSPVIRKSWHFRRVVPRPLFLLFTRIFISETGRYRGHAQKGLQECLNISGCISWPSLLLHQLLQLWMHHKTQNRTLMMLNQQMKEISKWNIPLTRCTVQVYEQKQEFTCKNLGQIIQINGILLYLHLFV